MVGASAVIGAVGSLLGRWLGGKAGICPHRAAVWGGGFLPLLALVAYGCAVDWPTLGALPALVVAAFALLGAGPTAHSKPHINALSCGVGAALGSLVVDQWILV